MSVLQAWWCAHEGSYARSALVMEADVPVGREGVDMLFATIGRSGAAFPSGSRIEVFEKGVARLLAERLFLADRTTTWYLKESLTVTIGGNDG